MLYGMASKAIKSTRCSRATVSPTKSTRNMECGSLDSGPVTNLILIAIPKASSLSSNGRAFLGRTRKRRWEYVNSHPTTTMVAEEAADCAVELCRSIDCTNGVDRL